MISVIIVNYHSAHLIKKAVESIISNDDTIEVFVVDNTATADERRALAALLPDSVHLIFNETNEGFARACNRAYASSSGQYILLLNPDSYFLPGAVNRLKDFLISNPAVGAVGPRIFWDSDKAFLLPPSLFPSAFSELCRQIGRISSIFSRLYSLSYRARSVIAWKTASPIKQRALSGGHVMLRRSAIEKCGGLFDGRFFMYYEDSDLMLRLSRAGYHLFIEPAAEVVHNYVHDKAKTALMETSGSLYFQKNFGSNIILNIASLMRRIPSHTSTMHNINAGEFRAPLSIVLPHGYKDHWLFEWSPSPDLVPSVGFFGKGPEFSFPAGAWDLLAPGTYYSRISSSGPVAISSSYLFWEKV